MAGEDAKVAQIIPAIIKEISGVAPRAEANIGKVQPGEQCNFQVALYNSTERDFTFKNLSAGCLCREILPKNGRIGPGETIKLDVKMTTEMNPARSVSGFSAWFNDGVAATEDFNLGVVYEFADYVGFGGDLVVIPTTTKALRSVIVVDLPVVIGSDVATDDLHVAIRGIDAALSVKAFEIDRGIIKLGLDFSSSKIDLDFDRIHGSIDMGSYKTEKLSTIPLVLERVGAIRLLPAIARFIQSTKDGPFEAKFYAKLPPSPAKTDNNAKPEQVALSCDATCHDIRFNCEASFVTPEVYQVTISIPLSKYSEIAKQLPDAKSVKDPAEINITVTCGDLVLDKALPIFFTEFARDN